MDEERIGQLKQKFLAKTTAELVAIRDDASGDWTPEAKEAAAQLILEDKGRPERSTAVEMVRAVQEETQTTIDADHARRVGWRINAIGIGYLLIGILGVALVGYLHRNMNWTDTSNWGWPLFFAFAIPTFIAAVGIGLLKRVHVARIVALLIAVPFLLALPLALMGVALNWTAREAITALIPWGDVLLMFVASAFGGYSLRNLDNAQLYAASAE